MSRTRVVHVKDQIPGAVYIGRAMPQRGLQAGKWGNPYKVGRDGTRAEVIDKYRSLIHPVSPDGWLNMNAYQELVGKPLACWCRKDDEERTPGNACHGDVLIEMIEELGLEATA